MSLFVHRPVLGTLLALLVLTGCQPLVRTSFTLEPPASASGKACIAQCEQASATCRRTCALQPPNCGDPYNFPSGSLSGLESIAPGSASDPAPGSASASVTLVHFGRMGSPDLDCSDLEPVIQSQRLCEAQCDAVYRGCYAQCGGTVTAHPTCIAFCREPPPKQP
jgi:hypothetical protein